MFAGGAVLGLEIEWFPIAAVALLTLRPQLALPTWAAPIVNACAGASLFLYLTHMQVHSVMDKTPLASNVIVNFIVAVVIGIGIWKVWELAYSQASRLLRAL
jgi:hypothetical protein